MPIRDPMPGDTFLPGSVIPCGNPEQYVHKDPYNGAIEEIRHIEACVIELEPMEPATRKRVMEFLWDKYVRNAPTVDGGK